MLVSYAILACLVWYSYIFRLSEVGLQEYDSVKNFFIVKEIAQGNFQEMFQHGSPTFFLFFAFVYKIFPSFLALEYTNAVLSVVAMLIFTHTFSFFLQYHFWEKCLLFCYMSSATYIVYGTRSFAIEAMTLLCFAVMLWLHFQVKNKKYFWFSTAIMLTINYKILLFFPVIFLFQFFMVCKNYQLSLIGGLKSIFLGELQTKFIQTLRQIATIFTLVFISYVVFGLFVGVSWKAYPAHWFFVLIMRKNLNAWQPMQTLHFDIDFYWHYWLHFESPLLLAGLLFLLFVGGFSFFHVQNLGKMTQTEAAQQKELFFHKSVFWLSFSCMAVVITLLEMSILPKAPRGILLILPILYLFAFECVRYYSQKIQPKTAATTFFWVIMLGSIAYQYWLIDTHIYSYTTTNYPKIANYLKEKKITKIATTVGINLKPFLADNTVLTPILFENDLQVLKKDGYRYCLIDDYHRLVGANVFDSLRNLPTVVGFIEPTLYSPLLYVEHCEFTGYTFEEALQTRQKVLQDSSQIRLIRIE